MHAGSFMLLIWDTDTVLLRHRGLKMLTEQQQTSAWVSQEDFDIKRQC